MIDSLLPVLRVVSRSLFFCVRSGCILLLAAPTAAAQTAAPITLFNPPLGFWVDKHTEGTGYDMRGATSPQANWMAASWFNPSGALDDFRSNRASNGATYDMAANPSQTIDFYPSGKRYSIWQTSRLLGCQTEFDSFVQTNPDLPQFPSARATPARHTLAGMEHLYHAITVELLPFALVGQPISCPENRPTPTQGVVMTALVLRDNFTDPPSTFFYQLRLAYFGEGLPPTSYDYPADEAWFGREIPPALWWHDRAFNPRSPTFKNIFGYSENISSYGATMAVPGKLSEYKIDMLPRLTSLIKSGTNGIDRELSHWIVLGTYHGDASWGHVRFGGMWSNFSLSAILAPTLGASQMPSCALKAQPSSISEGGSAALFFTSLHAIRGEIDNGVGRVGASGVQSVFSASPRKTTTYTATVVRQDGNTATCSATIAVR